MNGLVNGNGESVIMEAIANYVHKGKVFAFYVEDTDIDTGENKDTLIVTGNYECHIVFDLEAFGGQLIAEIYEDTQTSDNGTEIKPSAFNRVASCLPETKIYATPTVTNLGTKFVGRRVLAHSQGNNSITSALRASTERVLKPRSKYLLRQTGVSDNIAMTLVGTFYEEKY